MQLTNLSKQELTARAVATLKAMGPLSNDNAIYLCLIIAGHAAVDADWKREDYLESCGAQFDKFKNKRMVQGERTL
jgi:hypothetical protein